MFSHSLPPLAQTSDNHNFDKFKYAFIREDVRLAREMMRKQMLDLGVDYDDFYIAYSYSNKNNEWLATFRTIQEPLPPSIYRTVISAFNEAFPASYRSRLDTTAEVRMVCETDQFDFIDPRVAEKASFLAAQCADMFNHINFLKSELDGWQRGIDSDVYALLWPGVWAQTGSTCIFISLHVHGGHYRDDDPDFDGVRAFIRSLPEYRLPPGID
jgi:hypothetical protein